MRYGLLIWGMIFLLSCRREGKLCFSGAGDKTTVLLDKGDFSYLECYDNIHIDLVQDTADFVVLEGYSKVLSTVNASNESGVLKLTKSARCNWYRSYQKNEVSVRLHFKKLDGITFFDAGRISSLDTIFLDNFKLEGFDVSGEVSLMLKCDTLNILVHTGPAELVMKGTSNYTYAYSAGSGRFNLSGFNSKSMGFNHSGIADHSVYVTENLHAEIRSLGDLMVYGNPLLLTEDNTGSGELIIQ